MKPLLMITLLCLGTVNTLSHAMNQDEYFIGVKGGKSLSTNLNLTDTKIESPVVYALYGGMTTRNNLGFELEYAKTQEANVTKKSTGTNVGTLKTSRFNASITYKWFPMSQNRFYTKGKLGLANISGACKSVISEVSDAGNYNETGVSAGLGLGYDVLKNFGLEAEFNYIDPGVTNSDVTLGARYRF